MKFSSIILLPISLKIKVCHIICNFWLNFAANIMLANPILILHCGTIQILNHRTVIFQTLSLWCTRYSSGNQLKFPLYFNSPDKYVLKDTWVICQALKRTHCIRNLHLRRNFWYFNNP